VYEFGIHLLCLMPDLLTTISNATSVSRYEIEGARCANILFVFIRTHTLLSLQSLRCFYQLISNTLKTFVL